MCASLHARLTAEERALLRGVAERRPLPSWQRRPRSAPPHARTVKRAVHAKQPARPCQPGQAARRPWQVAGGADAGSSSKPAAPPAQEQQAACAPSASPAAAAASPAKPPRPAEPPAPVELEASELLAAPAEPAGAPAQRASAAGQPAKAEPAPADLTNFLRPHPALEALLPAWRQPLRRATAGSGGWTLAGSGAAPDLPIRDAGAAGSALATGRPAGDGGAAAGTGAMKPHHKDGAGNGKVPAGSGGALAWRSGGALPALPGGGMLAGSTPVGILTLESLAASTRMQLAPPAMSRAQLEAAQAMPQVGACLDCRVGHRLGLVRLPICNPAQAAPSGF